MRNRCSVPSVAMIFAIALILQYTIGVIGIRYGIKVFNCPLECEAGTICDEQPQVQLINAQTGTRIYNFDGSVYGEIGETSGYGDLYYGQEDCSIHSCGQKVVGPLVSVPFVNGLATFEVKC